VIAAKRTARAPLPKVPVHPDRRSRTTPRAAVRLPLHVARCPMSSRPLSLPSSGLRPCRCRSASILLEVLVTVTLLGLFMALIGGQILSSVRAAEKIERRQTAMLLAESMVSRLQAGGFDLAAQSQQLSGDFGSAYPGWGWQVYAEPTDDRNVLRVTLRVLQGDPHTSAGVNDYAPVTEVSTFWTIPRNIDLIADLGMSEQDAATFAAMTGGNIDPHAVDPRMLAALGLGDLAKMLPQLAPLVSQFGIDLSDIGDLDAFRSQLESMFGSLPAGDTGGGTGGDGSNANNDRGNNSDSNNNPQPFDWGELMRIAESGDAQAMQDYIEAHRDELEAGAAGMGRPGGTGNNPPGGGTTPPGGAVRPGGNGDSANQPGTGGRGNRGNRGNRGGGRPGGTGGRGRG